jgi:hypothetical protein
MTTTASSGSRSANLEPPLPPMWTSRRVFELPRRAFGHDQTIRCRPRRGRSRTGQCLPSDHVAQAAGGRAGPRPRQRQVDHGPRREAAVEQVLRSWDDEARRPDLILGAIRGSCGAGVRCRRRDRRQVPCDHALRHPGWSDRKVASATEHHLPGPLALAQARQHARQRQPAPAISGPFRAGSRPHSSAPAHHPCSMRGETDGLGAGRQDGGLRPHRRPPGCSERHAPAGLQ